LEPTGIVEIKYKRRDVLKTIRRLDSKYQALAEKLTNEKLSIQEKVFTSYLEEMYIWRLLAYVLLVLLAVLIVTLMIANNTSVILRSSQSVFAVNSQYIS